MRTSARAHYLTGQPAASESSRATEMSPKLLQVFFEDNVIFSGILAACILQRFSFLLHYSSLFWSFYNQFHGEIYFSRTESTCLQWINFPTVPCAAFWFFRINCSSQISFFFITFLFATRLISVTFGSCDPQPLHPIQRRTQLDFRCTWCMLSVIWIA